MNSRVRGSLQAQPSSPSSARKRGGLTFSTRPRCCAAPLPVHVVCSGCSQLACVSQSFHSSGSTWQRCRRQLNTPEALFDLAGSFHAMATRLPNLRRRQVVSARAPTSHSPPHTISSPPPTRRNEAKASASPRMKPRPPSTAASQMPASNEFGTNDVSAHSSSSVPKLSMAVHAGAVLSTNRTLPGRRCSLRSSELPLLIYTDDLAEGDVTETLMICAVLCDPRDGAQEFQGPPPRSMEAGGTKLTIEEADTLHTSSPLQQAGDNDHTKHSLIEGSKLPIAVMLVKIFCAARLTH